jgi:hypothetical protein
MQERLQQQAATRGQLMHRNIRRVRVAATAVDTAMAKPFSSMPEPLKGLPWLGAVTKVKLDQVGGLLSTWPACSSFKCVASAPCCTTFPWQGEYCCSKHAK